MKVWILSAHQGEYSDYTMTNIKVFADLESAEAYKAKLDETAELLERFTSAGLATNRRLPYIWNQPWQQRQAELNAAKIADPECVAAFEAANAALVAQGDEPLRSVTEYVSTVKEYSIEEHEVIGGE
jgi:hypothetical protein